MCRLAALCSAPTLCLVQCSAVPGVVLRCAVLRCAVLRCGAPLRSAPLCSAPLHYAALCSATWIVHRHLDSSVYLGFNRFPRVHIPISSPKTLLQTLVLTYVILVTPVVERSRIVREVVGSIPAGNPVRFLSGMKGRMRFLSGMKGRSIVQHSAT